VNFRSGLILSLLENGIDVIAVSPEDGYVERLVRLGCRYIPLAMDNKGTHPIHDFQLIIGFLNVFLRERPDAVLAYTVKPNIYASLASQLTGISVINKI